MGFGIKSCGATSWSIQKSGIARSYRLAILCLVSQGWCIACRRVATAFWAFAWRFRRILWNCSTLAAAWSEIRLRKDRLWLDCSLISLFSYAFFVANFFSDRLKIFLVAFSIGGAVASSRLCLFLSSLGFSKRTIFGFFNRLNICIILSNGRPHRRILALVFDHRCDSFKNWLSAGILGRRGGVRLCPFRSISFRLFTDQLWCSFFFVVVHRRRERTLCSESRGFFFRDRDLKKIIIID